MSFNDKEFDILFNKLSIPKTNYDDTFFWHEKNLLFSIDAFTEGTHFDITFLFLDFIIQNISEYLDTNYSNLNLSKKWEDYFYNVGLKKIAYRSLLSSISDIYASGGIPKGILTSIQAPSSKIIEYLLKHTQNFLTHFGITSFGGDVIKSDNIDLSITVIGEPIQRLKRLKQSTQKILDKKFLNQKEGFAPIYQYPIPRHIASNIKEDIIKNPTNYKVILIGELGGSLYYLELISRILDYKNISFKSVDLTNYQKVASKISKIKNVFLDNVFLNLKKQGFSLLTILNIYKKSEKVFWYLPNVIRSKHFVKYINQHKIPIYALMDVSDGLYKDLSLLGFINNLKIEINENIKNPKLNYEFLAKLGKSKNLNYPSEILKNVIPIIGGEDFALIGIVEQKYISKLPKFYVKVIGNITGQIKKQSYSKNILSIPFVEKEILEKINKMIFAHF